MASEGNVLGHCGLIVEAITACQNSHLKKSIYAVVPAHFFLTYEQRQANWAVQDHPSIDFSDELEFSLENATESLHLETPKLLSCRYWYPYGLDGFITDVALLKVAGNHQNIIAKNFKNEIYTVSNKGEIEELCNRVISIQGLEGRLISPPTLRNGRFGFGLHLAFVITSTDSDGQPCELKAGSRGSLLYLKVETGQLEPIGMFVGRLRQNRRVYQAVALSEVLKQVEDDYPHLITNIKVLGTCDPSTKLKECKRSFSERKTIHVEGTDETETQRQISSLNNRMFELQNLLLEQHRQFTALISEKDERDRVAQQLNDAKRMADSKRIAQLETELRMIKQKLQEHEESNSKLQNTIEKLQKSNSDLKELLLEQGEELQGKQDKPQDSHQPKDEGNESRQPSL